MTVDDLKPVEQSLTDPKDRQYAIFLHLSSLASYVLPFAGIILPIVLWSAKRDESPAIDRHGREVLNFTISYLIYTTVCAILCLVLIGFPMLMVVGTLVVVFPIVAAVRASEGRFWHYPGAIRFF